MSITDSKLATFLKKTRESKTLKYSVYLSLFIIGASLVYKIVTKLWFIIVLVLNHKLLSFFIFIIALIIGFFYANANMQLVDKFLFS
jgi:hypothetical protein